MCRANLQVQTPQATAAIHSYPMLGAGVIASQNLSFVDYSVSEAEGSTGCSHTIYVILLCLVFV